MSYLVSVHVPLAGMALIPLAAGWPVFLYPLHVVFLEFVIDPACTLAFEAEHSEAHTMDRPPRRPGERVFSLRMLLVAVGLGAAALAVVAAVYAVALWQGASPGAARALAFTALVCSNLALIVGDRSDRMTTRELLRRRNPVLWTIVAGAAAALFAVVYWPAAAELFRFERPAALAEAAAAASGLLLLALSDIPKRARGRPATRLM
jgi:Ca2+-transporting ATPase